MDSNLKHGDLTNERCRTYKVVVDAKVVYEAVFCSPKGVYYGPGHQFHRIMDQHGVVHLVSAPGLIFHEGKVVGYCEVKWEPANKDNPCRW